MLIQCKNTDDEVVILNLKYVVKVKKTSDYFLVFSNYGSNEIIPLAYYDRFVKYWKEYIGFSETHLPFENLDDEIENNLTTIEIKVNGHKLQTTRKLMSYEELLRLEGYSSDRILSVMYSSKFKDGILIPGRSVQLEEGMIIDICDTSNA